MHLPGPWCYWRDNAAVEWAYWAGDAAPVLDTHFHGEEQVTLVLSGSRRFEVDGQAFHIGAGQCLQIPAGVPHRTLPHIHEGTACLNLYIPGAKPQVAPLAGFDPIPDIAARDALSREGFTRKFARQFGMPPHAYRLAGRLNEARQRLRDGENVAGIAAELGFADQSHLGRHFRRVFGVSPRAYRDGARVTNVPDARARSL